MRPVIPAKVDLSGCIAQFLGCGPVDEIGCFVRRETGIEEWMKEPYVEGVATHDGPESCVVVRKGGGEALTGVRAGEVLSREIIGFGVPTLLMQAEGHTAGGATASPLGTSRGRRPSACAEPPCTGTGRSHGCSRGDGAAGRIGKAKAAIR